MTGNRIIYLRRGSRSFLRTRFRYGCPRQRAPRHSWPKLTSASQGAFKRREKSGAQTNYEKVAGLLSVIKVRTRTADAESTTDEMLRRKLMRTHAGEQTAEGPARRGNTEHWNTKKCFGVFRKMNCKSNVLLDEIFVSTFFFAIHIVRQSISQLLNNLRHFLQY